MLYHRIADEPLDPLGLCVSPRNFEEQLQVLTGELRPVSVEQLAGEPAGAVAVTLDDGYADNLHTALPLIEAAGIPATLFAATGHIARGQRFFGTRRRARCWATGTALSCCA